LFLFRYPKRDFRNPNKRTKIEKIAGNKKGTKNRWNPSDFTVETENRRSAISFPGGTPTAKTAHRTRGKTPKESDRPDRQQGR